MASTITLTGDWMTVVGNKRQVTGTGNLGTSYATGGVAITPAQLGLGVVDNMIIQPAGGYTFEYLPASGKVKAYRTDVPAGTVTDGAVTIVGSQAAGPALQVTPESNSGVLGKTSATTLTIPQATFGIAASSFTGGSAVPMAEVGAAVNLSAITFTFTAIGR